MGVIKMAKERNVTRTVIEGKTYDIYKMEGTQLTKLDTIVAKGKLSESELAKEYKVDIVVIGQYLRPTNKQVEVAEYIHPDVFSQYKYYAKSLGFVRVISSPLARSSYRASC
jgi:lipoic acid synthetase